jgi:hypothetical protein
MQNVDVDVLIAFEYSTLNLSQGSSGSIMSDYRLDDQGSIPDMGRGFFF